MVSNVDGEVEIRDDGEVGLEVGGKVGSMYCISVGKYVKGGVDVIIDDNLG